MASQDIDIIKKILIVVLFIALLVVTFLLIKPFLASILTAAVLAYILGFMYKKINSKIKNPNVSAFLICLIVFIVSIFFIFVLAKIAINEIVNFYAYTQTQDILAPFKVLLSANLPPQVSVFFNNAVEKITSSLMNYIGTGVMNLPLLFLQLFILFLVLFYFLRDSDSLMDYFKNVLPFRKKVREQFFLRFRRITESVIFGTIVVGAINGLICGIGFYIFNAPSPFILTVLAVIMGILPILGPGLVWFPASIMMFLNNNPNNAIGLFLYCIILTNIVYKLLMGRVISRRAKISNALALIGMLGGLELFGIIGLIIGPLVLDYLVLFIEFYRKGELKHLI